jgi:RimJ/RimL family protein N-acetyltransferase
MELRTPSIADLETVRNWRNETLVSLRTPYQLTEEMQAGFYRDVVCNRNANSRWWSVYTSDNLVAFTGLSGIEWENGLAEISLIVMPEVRGSNYGTLIVDMVLKQAFDYMGLSTVYGECYECNPAIEFWKKVTDRHGGYYTLIPRRKRWQGQLYDALHFSIWR